MRVQAAQLVWRANSSVATPSNSVRWRSPPSENLKSLPPLPKARSPVRVPKDPSSGHAYEISERFILRKSPAENARNTAKYKSPHKDLTKTAGASDGASVHHEVRTGVRHVLCART